MIIYKLTSPSGKSYIGMTILKLNVRWGLHVSSWIRLKKKGITNYRGHPCSPLLCFAFDKYTPAMWTREIIFETDDHDMLRDKEVELIKQYDTINNGYNVLTGGQFGHYGRELSEEHKNNQSAAMTEYWLTEHANDRLKRLSKRMEGNKLSLGKPPHNKGITGVFNHTEETKRKISEAQQDKVLSPEELERFRNINVGRKQTPEHITKRVKKVKGFKQTDYQKQKAFEARAEEWIVTHPDGKEERITGLRQFCITHGLSQGNLSTHGKTKGYKAQKL